MTKVMEMYRGASKHRPVMIFAALRKGLNNRDGLEKYRKQIEDKAFH